MKQVCIVGGLRSYIGVENGMYRNVSAEQLGAYVLREVVGKYHIPMEDIDLIVAGNGVGASGNLTRLMMLEAGFSEKIPAVTVDVQCGSGLEAIAVAAAKIESGLADVVIAGGFESCSTKPVRIRNKHHPDYLEGNDNQYQVAKFAPGKPDELAMLRGAENTAQKWKMNRNALDAFAIESHRKAAKTVEERKLQDILAFPLQYGEWCENASVSKSHYDFEMRTQGSLVKDEGIRPKISKKLLERLPVLIPGGKYITAGNACLTHDGAAFLVLCSRNYLNLHKIKEGAEIMDVVSAGGSPDESPESILPAVDKLILRNHLSADAITAWEYNEAFAVIDVLMEEHFGKNAGRYNIFGGALAYGHPYGASGGIITLHLVEALKQLEAPEHMNTKYGIAAIAAAGGVGTAILLARHEKNI